jgi:RNA polymerase sigma-70 factor (ECF subfamily)
LEGNDTDAVRAAQGGDAAAFAALVKRHQQRALAVAIGILRHGEDARDACQEAFLRAFRGLDRFDHEAQFSTWLYRIVVNVCLDRLRAKSAGVVALDDVAATLAGDDDPSRAVDGHQLGDRITAALDQLSEKHRTALVLREVQGLSYQEIAEAMHCSIGTVMSRLFHARKRMQQLLERDAPAYALAA